MDNDDKKYIPSLRFPEFLNDGEWVVKTFENIVEINSGKDYKHLDSGNIPVYGTGGYMLSVNDKLSDVDAVGIGRKGTIDKPQFLKAPFWTVDTLFYLINKNEYNINFILYLAETIDWKKYSEQTGVPSLSKATISKIKTIVPNVIKTKTEEQKRIADCLSSLDKYIDATKRKLEQLKEHKKGLMQRLFPAKGKTTPELRFPEFQNDEDWYYEYGNILYDSIVNKNHNSELPILAITQDNGAVPRDMINYRVVVEDKSIEGYKVVEVGDFIISLRSFQGGIEYSKYKGLCSPAYIVLRKKHNKTHDNFYRHYFKSYQYIQELNRNLEGIRDGKMVSYKQFSEIKIPYPQYEEQCKIADCLSSLDTIIKYNKDRIEKLELHKKGLMQQLFLKY